MAEPQRVTSSLYPYLPIRITIRGHSSGEHHALIDTGFTGHLAIPDTDFSADVLGLPDAQFDYELADGSTIGAPVYAGTVEIHGLAPVRAAITLLGSEHIIGRRILDRFKVTLDHGREVVLEP